jgi:hypothetical protein
MRERARRVARERFSFARHAELLLDVVEHAVAESGPREPRRRPELSRRSASTASH